jgi:hypothetical protein
VSSLNTITFTTGNFQALGVVYLKGSHLAHLKILFLFCYYIITPFLSDIHSQITQYGSRTGFYGHVTLSHHWRCHWNSTGLEATPSGPSHHSITHTHHHDNTSNTQQPQQHLWAHHIHILKDPTSGVDNGTQSMSTGCK